MGGGPDTAENTAVEADGLSTSAETYPEVKGHLLFTLSWPEPKTVTERIRRRYPNLKVSYRQVGGPKSGLAARLENDQWKDVTVLSTLGTLPKSPDLIPNMGTTNLMSVIEFIALSSAGVNWLVEHPIFKSSEIPLTTSSGIHGPTISEWVIMALLAHSHHYSLLSSWQRQAHWGSPNRGGTHDPRLDNTRDQVGATLGVLGYGSIGRQVARVAKAMGMRVLAYTASPRPTKESRHDSGYIVPGTGDPDGSLPAAWFDGLERQNLHAFLRQGIDVLLVSVPLTPQTKHFLSTEEFQILSEAHNKHTFIVNIARGQILDQDALIAALQRYVDTDGKEGVRGAALDVADPEPLPDGHPLFSAPNLFLSPHVSAHTVDYGERAAQVLELNLERWRKGERLVNLVDREKGY